MDLGSSTWWNLWAWKVFQCIMHILKGDCTSGSSWTLVQAVNALNNARRMADWVVLTVKYGDTHVSQQSNGADRTLLK